jgi:flagellar protein FliL
MKTRTIVTTALLLLVTAAASAGGAWWWTQRVATAPASATPAATIMPRLDEKHYRYVSLDSVIVMLRGTPAGQQRFLAVDLVLRSDKRHEPAVKSDLALLRSVVVRLLSTYSMEQAQAMSIDALAQTLRDELFKAYQGRSAGCPFDDALIARLIIE